MDAVARREDMPSAYGRFRERLFDRIDHLFPRPSRKQFRAIDIADDRDPVSVLRLDLSDVHPRDRFDRIDRVDARVDHGV